MKILNDVVKATTKFLELKTREYEDRTGKVKGWDMVSRVGAAKSVVIVALCGPDDNTKLLITKEFRVPIGDYEWGFPAGLINEGEPIEEAIRRELKEEAGLKLDTIVELSPFVYNSAGMTDECSCIAFVEASGELDTSLNEDSEEITPYLMDQNEICKLICDDSCKFGAKAWIILDRFATCGEVL